jgi:hypothetical protein
MATRVAVLVADLSIRIGSTGVLYDADTRLTEVSPSQSTDVLYEGVRASFLRWGKGKQSLACPNPLCLPPFEVSNGSGTWGA